MEKLLQGTITTISSENYRILESQVMELGSGEFHFTYAVDCIKGDAYDDVAIYVDNLKNNY